MEKLTLKEIAGYYPFKLQVMIKGKIVELTDMRGKYSISTQPQIHGFKYCSYDDFKPILYPLEMLTKTIVHNGVEIIPMDEINDLIGDLDVCISLWDNKELSIEVIQPGCEYTSERDENTVDISLSQIMEITSFLHELHFDLYGLLERNLAIDKSTLNSK